MGLKFFVFQTFAPQPCIGERLSAVPALRGKQLACLPKTACKGLTTPQNGKTAHRISFALDGVIMSLAANRLDEVDQAAAVADRQQAVDDPAIHRV